MNKYLLDQFSAIFDRGSAFSIILVLEKKRPAFYDHNGIDINRYKALIKIMNGLKLTFPYISVLFTNKVVIFDNTLFLYEHVRNVFSCVPRTDNEVKQKLQEEAKILGYPAVLQDINVLKRQNYAKWFNVIYKFDGFDIYAFFATEPELDLAYNDILQRKEDYNEIAKKLGGVVSLRIEENTFRAYLT